MISTLLDRSQRILILLQIGNLFINRIYVLKSCVVSIAVSIDFLC